MPLDARDLFAPGKASFAESLQEFFGLNNIQICSSGTAAIYASFKTLSSISSRRQVLIPAFTCPLVPLAAARAGLEIVLVDTAADSYEFDLAELEKKLSEKTLCIVHTHLGGIPAATAPVLKLARAVGAYVIEDAAQSFGAREEDKLTGTIGDIGIISFALGKGLTLVEGGAALINNAELEEVAAEQFALAFDRSKATSLRGFALAMGYYLLYRPQLLPLSYNLPLKNSLSRGQILQALGEDFSADFALQRLSKYQLALGAAQFHRWPDFFEANRERAAWAKKLLDLPSSWTCLAEKEGDRASYPFISLLAPDLAQRDRLLGQFWTEGYGLTRLFAFSLNEYPYLEGIVPEGNYQNAHDFAQRHLTLSTSVWLRREQLISIGQAIKEIAQH